jgi:hypothetical protein
MDIIIRLVSDDMEPSDFFGGDIHCVELITGQWYVEGGEKEIQLLLSSIRNADALEGDPIFCGVFVGV